MPRRRDIDPAFWQDEKCGTLSMGAQLLFIWTWGDADDWGVLRWRPERCKSGAFLYRPRINLGHVREYMAELERARMVVPWMSDGERWSVVRMFLPWQSVNTPAQSKCPAPPADVVALLPPLENSRSWKLLRRALLGEPGKNWEIPAWVRARFLSDPGAGADPGALVPPSSTTGQVQPHPPTPAPEGRGSAPTPEPPPVPIQEPPPKPHRHQWAADAWNDLVAGPWGKRRCLKVAPHEKAIDKALAKEPDREYWRGVMRRVVTCSKLRDGINTWPGATFGWLWATNGSSPNHANVMEGAFDDSAPRPESRPRRKTVEEMLAEARAELAREDDE
ncbi:MAG: hypothetical protein WC789_10490 [Lentisphaeria bacterium]